MRKLTFCLLAAFSLAACKKMPIREDLNVKLKSIDNTPFHGDPSNTIITIQAGQTKVFKLEFSGGAPLKEYKIGTDYSRDQSSYEIKKPEIGATSGVFEFSMDVNALINGIEINNSSSQVFKVDMIDEEGTVGSYAITVKKQM